jgi:hypothetical protein
MHILIMTSVMLLSAIFNPRQQLLYYSDQFRSTFYPPFYPCSESNELKQMASQGVEKKPRFGAKNTFCYIVEVMERI